MKYKTILTALGASLGMLVLILDGQTALQGARDGITLCMQTVIPSLFPFFVLAILLTNSLSGFRLSVIRPIARFLGIPKGGESLLLSGFLGGYPAGAQCIFTAYQSGNLTKQEAERMLGFCSNAGPAFLFGMVTSLFPSITYVWILWCIHIASAFLAAKAFPVRETKQEFSVSRSEISLRTALRSAISVMASVCGWVVLFRVLIAFFRRWFLWMLPGDLQILLIGFLELSNGCWELVAVENMGLRFILCSGMLAFGGICVTMQTLSVIGELSPRNYLLGKLIQTACSLVLSLDVVYRNPVPLSPIILGLLFLLQNFKKSSSIRNVIDV